MMQDIIDPNSLDVDVRSGRPRMALLVGQKRYIERAYCVRGMSQARIAQHVGIAIPRVRRHLISQGLYIPRAAERSVERIAQLSEAVQAYADGELVTEICSVYSVNPATLYMELRRRNVPFRTKHSTLFEEVHYGKRD